MYFKEFAQAVNRRLNLLAAEYTEFYLVDLPDIYDHYLASFPEGSNPIFRERPEHDCQTCKQFIRNLGRMVVIHQGQVHTVWDLRCPLPYPYASVAAAMDALVKFIPIASIFRTSEAQFGRESNFDTTAEITWHHLWGRTPQQALSPTPGAALAQTNAAFQVFKRGLDELRESDFDDVLALIDDNAIYRGEEHRRAIVAFRSQLRAYHQAPNKDLYVWERINYPEARFRNTAIGTLFVDLADGKPLEDAVKAFESKVAPLNYKRPTSLITPRMIEDAVATLKRLDLEDSIARRFATPEDVSVNDILFVDNDIRSRTRDGLTALLMESVRPPALPTSTQELSIDEFLALRPTRIELLLEQRHLANFVSLTAPVHPGAPSLFKWDNGFAWAYDGDVTDSIRDRVKRAGGNVDAKLRCSLAWSNYDDLDIHCRTPDGHHIYYASKRGVLDVDMNAGGRSSRTPVENLSWNNLVDGTYFISVHNFNQRETIDTGFVLEVEHGGIVHQFSHPAPLLNDHEVDCLNLHIKDGVLTHIETHSGITADAETPIEKWGIKTLTPTRVNMLMLSPNHWENSARSGNKHYFFILDKCLNPDPIRGIFNEYLTSALEPHRKVFEVLGSKTKCQPSNNQLSGVGFSSTRSDSVRVKVDGRPLTITF